MTEMSLVCHPTDGIIIEEIFISFNQNSSRLDDRMPTLRVRVNGIRLVIYHMEYISSIEPYFDRTGNTFVEGRMILLRWTGIEHTRKITDRLGISDCVIPELLRPLIFLPGSRGEISTFVDCDFETEENPLG